MGVWVGLTMFGGGFVGLGWVSPGLGRVCSLVSPTLRTRLLYECLLYFCFTYTFLCLTSDAHEARRPSFCNALDEYPTLAPTPMPPVPCSIRTMEQEATDSSFLSCMGVPSAFSAGNSERRCAS